MSQPTSWERTHDFTDEIGTQHGINLDEEFNDGRLTVSEILANLALIQRDDTKLANAAVHPDALSSATLALIASEFTPQGEWVIGTDYEVGDIVEVTTTGSYVAVTAHTAGAVFTTDKAAGRWVSLSGTPLAVLAASTSAALIGTTDGNVQDDLDGKQPLDATLTGLAGVTVAADKVIYATGADAFAATDLTAAARSILDDASVGAIRTTLGVGTADTPTFAGLTATAPVNTAARVDVASVAGTTAIDAITSNYIRITGTNTITALTLTDGRWRDVVAGGAFAITTGASLIIDGLASGTTYRFAAGDTFTVRGEASSVVRVSLNYTPRLDAVTATTEVVSTASETTVYTKSIPGGTLGVDRALRLTLLGDYLNNSGATRELTVKVKYGATTVCNIILNTIAGSATRKDVRILFDLHAKAATNAQVASGTVMTSAGTATQTGVAVSQFNHMAGASGHNAVAIDSTADQNLVVTVEHSAADANLSFKMLSARLEVVR